MLLVLVLINGSARRYHDAVGRFAMSLVLPSWCCRDTRPRESPSDVHGFPPPVWKRSSSGRLCTAVVRENGHGVCVARWYDPGTGQFMSVDPDLAETDQPYAYASDDPVNASDRSGDFECNAPGYPSCLSQLQDNVDGSLTNGFTIYRYFTAQKGLSSNEAAGIAGALVEESGGNPWCVGVVNSGDGLTGGPCNVVSTAAQVEYAQGDSARAGYGIAQWTAWTIAYSEYGGFLKLLGYAASQHEPGCSGALSGNYGGQLSCWKSVSRDMELQLNFLWSLVIPGGVWNANFTNAERKSDSAASASSFGGEFDKWVIGYGSIGTIAMTSAEGLAGIFSSIQYAFSTC